jgi:hypothetical protein
MDTKDFEVAAQEMSLHIALCVASQYIHSWSTVEFLEKLQEYIESDSAWYDIQHAIDHLKERRP